MKRRLARSLTVLSLTAAVAVAAPGGASRPPAATPPWNVPPDPVPVGMPTIHQLQVHGLRVRARNESSLPRVSASLLVRAATGVPNPTAVSLLQSAVLRVGGTRAHPGLDFLPFLARTGLTLDVATAPDHLELTVSGPSGQLPEALQLLADLAQRPAYPEAQVSRARDALRLGLDLRRGYPLTVAVDQLMLELFADHAYAARVEPRGLETITHDVLASVHGSQFAPAQAILAVTSPLEPPALEAALEAAFGTWTTGSPQTRTPPTPREKGARVQLPVEGDGSAVVAGCTVPPDSELDQVAARVLTRVLEAAVRRGLSLPVSSHDAGARYASYSDAGALWLWTSGPDMNPLTGVVEGLLARAGRGKLTDREILEARAGVTAELLASLSGIDDVVRASALSELLGRRPAWPARQVQLLRTVSAEDVRRVARTLLGKGRVVVVTSGPRDALARIGTPTLAPGGGGKAVGTGAGLAEAKGAARVEASAGTRKAHAQSRKKRRAGKHATRGRVVESVPADSSSPP